MSARAWFYRTFVHQRHVILDIMSGHVANDRKLEIVSGQYPQFSTIGTNCRQYHSNNKPVSVRSGFVALKGSTISVISLYRFKQVSYKLLSSINESLHRLYTYQPSVISAPRRLTNPGFPDFLSVKAPHLP